MQIHGASSELTRLSVSAEFVSSRSLNLAEQLQKLRLASICLSVCHLKHLMYKRAQQMF